MRRQTYGYLPGRRASPPFGQYQIVLLGDRGTWVLTTCPELLPGDALAGVEPGTSRSRVQRANHYTTKPPAKTHSILQVFRMSRHVWEAMEYNMIIQP